MLHPYLAKVQKKLKKQKLYSSSPFPNVLLVSEDKKSSHFAYLIVEEETFNGIIISLAIDYPDSCTVAELVMNCMYTAPSLLGEKFFVNQHGDIFWNEDSQMAMDFELDNPNAKDKFTLPN